MNLIKKKNTRIAFIISALALSVFLIGCGNEPTESRRPITEKQNMEESVPPPPNLDGPREPEANKPPPPAGKTDQTR
ncbi:MAG: hypothetical protein ACOC23_07530 [Thermodesulfobacteriota bacterium]